MPFGIVFGNSPHIHSGQCVNIHFMGYMKRGWIVKLSLYLICLDSYFFFSPLERCTWYQRSPIVG